MYIVIVGKQFNNTFLLLCLEPAHLLLFDNRMHHNNLTFILPHNYQSTVFILFYLFTNKLVSLLVKI